MKAPVDENDFFREATLKIFGSLEVEKALWQSLLYLQKFIPAVRMSFHTYNAQAGAVETVAYANPSGSVRLSLQTPLPSNARARIEGAKSIPPVRIVDPLGADAIGGPLVRELKEPNASGLIMHLAMEKTVQGVLVLTNRGEEAFTAYHAHLLGLLQKPFTIALTNILQYREVIDLKDLLADDNQYLQAELRRLAGGEIIGADSGLKQAMLQVNQVASLSSPVLLLGETGVGKEVIARAIHGASPRKEGPFVIVNCGAIPETLLDSELFGHEKGAFTGALSSKRGRFERASGGTIFLDEIGELPLEAQVRLLRVIQEKEIERVGGQQPIRVDIRIIAATHRNLDEMMVDGTFRQDLYFRLNVFPIRLPPLRERVDDIPELVSYFIRKKAEEIGVSTLPTLAESAVNRLKAYPWPGNVRELGNRVEREMILSRGSPLNFEDVEASSGEVPTVSPVDAPASLLLDEIVAEHLKRVLTLTDGRIEGDGGAADLLGMHPGTLRHRLRKLAIPFGRKVKNRYASSRS